MDILQRWASPSEKQPQEILSKAHFMTLQTKQQLLTLSWIVGFKYQLIRGKYPGFLMSHFYPTEPLLCNSNSTTRSQFSHASSEFPFDEPNTHFDGQSSCK